MWLLQGPGPLIESEKKIINITRNEKLWGEKNSK